MSSCDTTGVPPADTFFIPPTLIILSNDLQERGGMMTEIVIQPPKGRAEKNRI